MFQCLSSTVGFGFGCSYIARYEEQGIGLQWYNIGSSPIPEDDFSLSSCIWMMLIDSAIYLVITWYVEAVFPGWFSVTCSTGYVSVYKFSKRPFAVSACILPC